MTDDISPLIKKSLTDKCQVGLFFCKATRFFFFSAHNSVFVYYVSVDPI